MENVDESTRVRKEMHPSPLLVTPKKSDLRGKLMKLEENPLGMSTDDINKAKSNAVQIHHNQLESHYKRNTGNRSDATPKTGQFMSMVSNMIDVSKDGAVATNLHESMASLGHRYTGIASEVKRDKVKQTLGTVEASRTLVGANRSKSCIGADHMIPPEKAKRQCDWTGVEKEVFQSLESMYILWTPNEKSLVTRCLFGDCRVSERRCSHDTQCQHKSRFFYYLPGGVDLDDADYEGPVCYQIAREHTCGKDTMTWSDFLGSKGRIGLHPFLRLKVKKALLANPSLRPRECYRQLLNEHQSEDRTDLFPIGKIGVVKNQIVDCFNYERNKRLGVGSNNGINMKYVHDISRFRNLFKTRVPENYKASGEVFDCESARKIANSLLLAGTKFLSIEKDYEKEKEHCLLVLDFPPPDDDTTLGANVKLAKEMDQSRVDDMNSKNKVFLKDDSTSALSNFMAFSSINLLRLVCTVAKRFHFVSMATMDTTWSITASGGKLMAFGINYMRKRGNRGSKYARHFVPLIMAHVYLENEETAILLLETMKYWSMKLFGVRLKFLGGLVCDQSDAFINAFEKVFPDSRQGQDHSHVVMKFNDQPGKRGKQSGTAGYLKHLSIKGNRNYLMNPMKDDVNKAYRCKTRALQVLYASLSGVAQWKLDGEAKIAEVFSKSYLLNLKHLTWRFNEFGCPGLTPTSNPQERFHLGLKGTKSFYGLCTVGLSLRRMFYEEPSRLIRALSIEMDDVDFVYKIRNYADCQNDSSLMSQVANLKPSDVCPSRNSFFVNGFGFEGAVIDDE
jgi:hypothetical protein